MEKFELLFNKEYIQSFEQYIAWLKDDPLNMIALCIDLLLVLYLAKKLYSVIKDTYAIQLLKGIVILIGIMFLSRWLNLYILNYILKSIMAYGVILIIIVFEPELRRTLGDIGNNRFKKLFKIGKKETLNDSIISNISSACDNLSKRNIGALVVLERDTNLIDYTKTGVGLGANLSKELIINIFEPNTPLHDGAIIVSGEEIKAAACILPLTKRNDLKYEFGTRHRAGIGISEVSDCISIIVSEETGKISLAMNGKISTNLSLEQLEKFLKREILKEIEE